jgi:ATP-dependent RNA helicase DeaD
MESLTLPTVLGPALLGALQQKGYSTLTAVQTAVLDPAFSGRDLRITSQTGSGKTVAVGFALREFVAEKAPGNGKEGALARPRALVIAPTRELAKQVEAELSWLFAPLAVSVISVTGGAGYGDERRALARKPAVIVATPGRLLEHLRRGSIDAGAVRAVVLDEADRLLDLGFREDLDAILMFAPAGHQTHMVSATFPRDVRALADATQKDPVHVEGTRLGAANADIDHVVHLIDGRQRIDALVNLLLANPDAQTLVFARTRADVAAIARELKVGGFAAMSLSGEMDQAARNRALAAFKSGELRVLVATDVAARGIDVQDIARVVHAEPPLDADSYTHRSGRTGRAGRKGTSSILAALPELARTTFLLQRAGVAHRFEAIPSADAIRTAANERVATALASEDEDTNGFDDRTWALAKQIAAQVNVTRAIARLLIKTRYAGPTEPRNVRAIEPPSGRGHSAPGRFSGGSRPGASRWRNQDRDLAGAERAPREVPRDGRAPRDRQRADAQGGPRGAPSDRNGSWIPFRVSWGEEQGADARRLLAVACRRGQIRGTDVGSIRVGRSHSVIEVASHVADAFALAAGGPDPRDPRMTIEPERAASREEFSYPVG